MTAIPWRRLLIISAAVFFFSIPPQAAGAGDSEEPAWLPTVEARAEAGGWRIITPTQLKILMSGSEDFLLVDARPDYEYAAGTLEGAVNLEFHEGHRSRLDQAKAQEMEKVLGPDQDRKIIFFCRSFR